ncbi:glycosyltransferase family 4 protein [Novosphingobium sp. RD2P27]|uniref:Glycosyltransferase family 4 protein n=1 Tax=Novosphingobium kalidii TaxID=3230299 RepID=A0ABV2D484_9SPHN
MRICSILTSFTTGGAETLVENLSATFAARGHYASVLSLSDAAQVGNPANIEQQMRERLHQAGVDTQSLALENRRNIVTGTLAFRKALQSVKPDIIHSHTAGALPILALAAARVPVVLTHHNSRLSFPPRAYWMFDRIVSRYVAISEQCKLQTQHHARRPVHTILNAASPRFRASTARSAPARHPIILAVGTPSEQKDYATLVRAAAHLREAMQPLGRRPLIQIVGGGAWVESLRELIRKHGVVDIVEVTGARSDVDALMREADVLVNSSLWEGFPIAMIEASMSALPIIATDVAGNREMVTDDVSGLLIPPRDPRALARALVRVLNDAQLYRKLSVGSLAAAQRFSIEHCADEHLSLYREVTDESTPYHDQQVPTGQRDAA